MTSENFLFSGERKILLTVVFTICCTFYGNFAAIIIDDYNQEVEQEQTDKNYAANNPEKSNKISFEISHCYSTPFFSFLFWLQLFTNPILYLVTKKISFYKFILSIFLSFLTILSLILWNIYTYKVISLTERLPEDFRFNDYLLYGSTTLELILYPLFVILFTLQMFFLFRFVIGRFQAKISLK